MAAVPRVLLDAVHQQLAQGDAFFPEPLPQVLVPTGFRRVDRGRFASRDLGDNVMRTGRRDDRNA